MRIRSKRAVANHGIVWVRQDIQHRREVHIDADAPQLSPHCLTYSAGERGRAGLAETGG